MLFAIDGPVWDTRRKRMNPHFSTSAFRAFAPSVSMITRRALVQLDQYAKSGQAFDLDYFTIGTNNPQTQTQTQTDTDTESDIHSVFSKTPQASPSTSSRSSS